MWHTVSSELCFHPCVNLSTFSGRWQVSVCFFFYAVIENSHKNNEIRKYSRCVYREHAQLQKVQDNVQLGKRSLKCCECLKCSVLSTYALVRFYGTSLDDSSQRGRWLLLVCQKPMSQNVSRPHWLFENCFWSTARAACLVTATFSFAYVCSARVGS